MAVLLRCLRFYLNANGHTDLRTHRLTDGQILFSRCENASKKEKKRKGKKRKEKKKRKKKERKKERTISDD